MSINHTGFNDDQMVGDIDLEKPVHARQADDNATRSGKRTAAQPGSGAAAHEGNFVARTDLHNVLDLLRVARQHNGGGQHSEVREPVALVRLQLVGSGDDSVVSNDTTKF